MNHIKVLSLLLGIVFLVACTEDEPNPQISIPDQFTIDIPEPISSNTGSPSGRTTGDGDGIVEGNEIYESLRGFIHIGDQSAQILKFTLVVAAALETSNVSSITFSSDDDNREKRLDLTENVTRGGVTYAYEMTMFDVADNEQALQLLWNTAPTEGLGILRPFYVDRSRDDDEDAYIRIDYSEDHPDYEATMTVTISGVEPVENGDIDNLKMFVGKNGDIVEVMGNSNHPDIVILDDNFTGGRNYAFVGRGDDAADLGVVNLALPPSSITTDDVLTDYSVFTVLEDEIQSAGLTDQTIIDAILVNAHSPAYFNNSGFITSGTDNKPASFSDSFVDLSGMSPFVPNDIKNLSIGFIQ